MGAHEQREVLRMGRQRCRGGQYARIAVLEPMRYESSCAPHHARRAACMRPSAPQRAYLVLADGAAQHVARKGNDKVVGPRCEQVTHHRGVGVVEQAQAAVGGARVAAVGEVGQQRGARRLAELGVDELVRVAEHDGTPPGRRRRRAVSGQPRLAPRTRKKQLCAGAAAAHRSHRAQRAVLLQAPMRSQWSVGVVAVKARPSCPVGAWWSRGQWQKAAVRCCSAMMQGTRRRGGGTSLQQWPLATLCTSSEAPPSAAGRCGETKHWWSGALPKREAATVLCSAELKA
jgi:hypothetical protein